MTPVTRLPFSAWEAAASRLAALVVASAWLGFVFVSVIVSVLLFLKGEAHCSLTARPLKGRGFYFAPRPFLARSSGRALLLTWGLSLDCFVDHGHYRGRLLDLDH